MIKPHCFYVQNASCTIIKNNSNNNNLNEKKTKKQI